MKNLGHVMVDIETMGNESNSVIVSIGAIEFDINTGEVGKQFYCRVNLQSCLDLGLIVNGETIYWWLKQNEAARLEICKDGDDILTALFKLSNFLNEIDATQNFQIWSNGVRFDISLLSDAYRKAKLSIPWNFHNERDVRTLVSFTPKIIEHYPFEGIPHHSIDDCKHQIAYCSAIWQKLNFNTDNL